MAEYHSPKTYDPETGFTQEMWYDDIDKKVHVRRTAPIEHIYRENAIVLANSPKDFYRDDGMYHKARIPNYMIEKWLIEDGFNWYKSTDAERRAKINQHPEFHVRKGKI